MRQARPGHVDTDAAELREPEQRAAALLNASHAF
jgi:hypothetical protein